MSKLPIFSKTHFFDSLENVQPEFYNALYFAPQNAREPIAALLILLKQWLHIQQKTTEPMVLQIRLKWWHEQFDLYYGNQNPLLQNTPPEMTLLRAYDLRPLIIAINNEEKAAIIYGLVFKIIGFIVTDTHNYDAALEKYGQYYAVLLGQDYSQIMPRDGLPMPLRFIRVPLILLRKSNKLSRFLELMKNFFLP